MRDPHARSILLLAVLLTGMAFPPAVSAQETDGPWTTEAELGGAYFFGNTSQTTITTRLGTERADSVREVSLDGRFAYGEARDDEGNDFVNKRSWKVSTSFDHHPFERWSPFATGELESSFERRIELRYTFGVGAKYTVTRSDRGRLDFSGALLGEETNPSDGANVSPDFDDDLLARWSFRARARRSWDEGRLTFSSESSYRPEFSHWDDFTFTSTTSVGFRLNETLGLKLTFVDTYDSEAEARGARTNNDGQVLASLLATF